MILTWADVFAVVENFIHTANKSTFGFDITYVSEMQFTEYHKDDAGKYAWHEDIDWRSGSFYHREISMVVQLTDPSEYEGGELELAVPHYGDVNINVVKSKGTVASFPSFIRHRVTRVTKGKRYSLVAWMQGPRFR